MVSYTLRDPNRNPPVAQSEMVMHQVEVNPFVRLKADRGIGALLVEEIRSIARLKTFELPKIDLFCQQYQVTDKQALRNLLQDLKEKDLILEDPDVKEPWDVKKIGKKWTQLT